MRQLQVVLLSCFLVGCGATRAADKSNDTTNLQGTWKMVSCVWNGEPQNGNVQWVVSGDRYTVQLDGKSAETSTITLDGSKKHIDVFHHDTPQGTYGGKLKGIYELKGDSLKVCYDLKGQRYPTSFEAGKGSGQVLYQLKREGR
jgi:uncharacterized protein (TIGR03067 family)